ncbi:hypothetical protein KCU83_g280, partial [Aureobasidium melanogenum]
MSRSLLGWLLGRYAELAFHTRLSEYVAPPAMNTMTRCRGSVVDDFAFAQVGLAERRDVGAGPISLSPRSIGGLTYGKTVASTVILLLDQGWWWLLGEQRNRGWTRIFQIPRCADSKETKVLQHFGMLRRKLSM